MKSVCAVALIILCGMGTQVAAGTATVYGAGTESCGKWIASSTNPGIRAWEVSWVLGWLTAAGYYRVAGDLKETDSDAIAAWVDNYCRANPLDTVGTAATGLIKTLAERGKS
jgi:hypothetical protein